MFGIKKFLRGLKIVPKTTLESDEKGELEVDNTSGKLNFHNGTTRSPVVTESHSATVTNKSIDADNNTISNLEVDNLKAGVLNTSTTLAAASDTQVPSALAVKTFIEDELAFQDQASEITLVPVGTIVATNVQDAVAELDGDIQGHINDTVDAHDATAVSYSNTTSGLTATDVQTAIDQVEARVDAVETSSGNTATNLSNHINDTVDAHDASAISNVPAGTIAATDVQSAINELDGDVQGHVTASTNVHGIGAGNSVVGTGTTQTLTNKTITGADIRTPVRSDVKQDTKANLTTYALTATNGQLVFATDTKEMFQVVDAALVPVGSGGAEGDVDTLFVQNFETAALTDFTQTGLVLTQTNPIRGEISARLVHQAAINQSFKQVIPVDRKFRGIPMTVSLAASSTALSGNLIIQFRDETNAIDLQESQQIIATSDIQTFQFGVTIPANCASFSYTITALPQSGSPESIIDDIVIRNYWMGTANLGQSKYQFEVPVTTEWQSYTPVFQNLGTVTEIDMKWRRVGPNIEIQGRWTNGTVAGGQAAFSLPTGLSSGLTNFQVVGIYGSQGPASSEFPVVWNPVNNWFSFSSANWQIFQSGTNMASVGFTSVQVKMPIQNWTATEKKSVIVNDLVPAKALSGNSSIEVPVTTEWQSYVPTFNGFGTPTNIEMQWRQNGQNVEIRGKFTSGTSTAVEARVGLPSGLISASSLVIPSLQLVGYAQRNAATTNQYGVLIEPNVSYVTFSAQGGSLGITKEVGNQIIVSGQNFSLFASVPCVGLTATRTETIGLAQSVLTQEADSTVRVTGIAGSGSTNTKIVRFSTIQQNKGSSILYQQSATLGDSFTVLESGVYDISMTIAPAGAGFVGISKNSTQLTTDISNINPNDCLGMGYGNTNGEAANVAGSFELNAGDVIRAHFGATLSTGLSNSSFTITRQGSLKQINVNPNQKITIPTSELRMEGASTRGSTATAIVRFDNIAKIRGDAFEVLSDATLGTRIVMKKKGKLAISANVFGGASTSNAITLNQTILTNYLGAGASEVLARQGTSATANANSLSWLGEVKVGDVIRVSGENAPSAQSSTSLNLFFQEQDISVSVTNTLPQFSESDSSVRVDTANGFGSTGTRIRRFSNVRDNIGSDIEYVDDAVNGARFVVKTDGTYNISYSDSFNAPAYIGISVNTSSLTTLVQSLPASERVALARMDDAGGVVSVSAQPYLLAGTVIRAHTDGVATGTAGQATFTISKVGKPNVTGVDVTPFVNVPVNNPPETVIAKAPASVATIANVPTIIPLTALEDNKGSFVLQSNGVKIPKTAKYKATINTQAFGNGEGVTLFLYVNGALSKTGAAKVIDINASGSYSTLTDSFVVDLNVNDIASVYVGIGTSSRNVRSTELILEQVTNLADDNIITANESFSTDTANLVYAPSSLYTLSTLANAPVGTFITFTYAASTNTRTQTTTAPTQTTADMNVNGIRLFTRPYNAASTASQPSTVAIQIGKGLKGRNIDLYKSTGKNIQGSLDFYLLGAGNEYGVVIKEYNELTGILVIDIGFAFIGVSNTTKRLVFSDTLESIDGYFVINASKSPALTGVPLLQPRIATIKDVKASGNGGGTPSTGAYFTRTLNTLEDPTGIVTSLTSSQFVLPAGQYFIEADSTFYFAAQSGIVAKIKLRNVTDGVDVITGNSTYVGASVNGEQMGATALLNGVFTISTPKTFEIQYRTNSSSGSGLGVATSFGDNETYTQVILQKVK